VPYALHHRAEIGCRLSSFGRIERALAATGGRAHAVPHRRWAGQRIRIGDGKLHTGSVHRAGCGLCMQCSRDSEKDAEENESFHCIPTVPENLTVPLVTTGGVGTTDRSNVPMTVELAVIENEHDPVPLHPPVPLQPVKVDPAAGVAVHDIGVL